MKRFYFFFVLALMLSIIFISSCDKDRHLPVLNTLEVTEITTKTALSGGEVVSDGGYAVIERGVCWAITENPTISDNKTVDGEGLGSFESKIHNLYPNTIYYVRAYATNSEGTKYGENIIFSTIKGSFTDSRDDNTYRIEKYGNQIWMVENLKYLPSVIPSGAGSSTTAYCYVYDYQAFNVEQAKETDNYKQLGVLYNWTAAQDACPEGWHLPSDSEWVELETYLADNGYNYDGSIGGGSEKLAISMASQDFWETSDVEGATGNPNYKSIRDKTGFTAIPVGVRNCSGNFFGNGIGILWWTSSESHDNYVWFRKISHNSPKVLKNYVSKDFAYSVRCIKD